MHAQAQATVERDVAAAACHPVPNGEPNVNAARATLLLSSVCWLKAPTAIGGALWLQHSRCTHAVLSHGLTALTSGRQAQSCLSCLQGPIMSLFCPRQAAAAQCCQQLFCLVQCPHPWQIHNRWLTWSSRSCSWLPAPTLLRRPHPAPPLSQVSPQYVNARQHKRHAASVMQKHKLISWACQLQSQPLSPPTFLHPRDRPFQVCFPHCHCAQVLSGPVWQHNIARTFAAD